MGGPLPLVYDVRDRLLIVKQILEDPEFLNQPFITSTHFKKEADASGWKPSPCSAK